MKELWNDFRMETFDFEDREGRIIYPDVEPIGKIIFKPEYLYAFPNFEIEMLKRGYYLCNISHYNRWAPDYEIEIMEKFVKHVANKLGASQKCIIVGMSCGGLQAAKFAERYPELVASVYLDAPVLNLLSMAGLGDAEYDQATRLEFWREMVSAYGFSKSTIVNFRESPIDNMQPLIDNDIPIIMLYGNCDSVVLYEENGKVLEKFYKDNGGTMKVIERSMGKHHPHSLDNPQKIVDFIEKYSKF